MIGRGNLAEVARRGWEVQRAEVLELAAPVGERLPYTWREKLTPAYSMGPTWVYEVDDVHLAGPALVGFKDGDVLLDQGYYGRLDLWERNYTYFQMARSCLTMPAVEVPCAMVMASCWTGNYFHWVLDELPKLEGAEVYAGKTSCVPMLIAPAYGGEFVAASLEQSGLPYELTSNLHIHVSRLIVVTPRRLEGRIAPSAMRFLRFHAANVAHEVDTSRRIYITRRGATTRRVVNESAVVEMLLGRGFAVCQLERMSLAEQQQRFSGAEIIVGPHGAGLANLAWVSEPGRARVLELVAPQYTNPCCWLAGAAAGMRYGYLVGDGVGKEDLRVDVGALETMLDRLEAE